MTATIFSFVKLFENKEFAEDFLRGRLYMNSIRSFKEYKDKNGELRGDSYEGITQIYQPKYLKEVNIGDHTFPATQLSAPIAIHSNSLLDSIVFCIYSLNSRGHTTVSSATLADFKKTLTLHEKCFGLGEYCVVISNPTEFINRCTKKLKFLNVSAELSLVDYFDENNFHGLLPSDNHGFQKRSLFSHQREYRIKISHDEKITPPFFLEVGDLSDIAFLMTPDKFNSELLVMLPDGSKA